MIDVYVNVNYGSLCFFGPGEEGFGLFFVGTYFVQIGLQINQLRFKLAAVLGEDGQELAQLRRGVARAVVGVDDFLGLNQ